MKAIFFERRVFFVKRRGQPVVRFPVRLPKELWRVLKNDRELGKTRVLVEYWEPSMNSFIMYLIVRLQIK